MNSHRILPSLLTALLLPAFLWAGEGKIRRSPHAIKDEYIVVLKDDVAQQNVHSLARRLAEQHNGELKRVWQDALKGFFVRMTEAHAQGLSHHPDVRYIEENAEMFLAATVPTKMDPSCGTTPCPTADNRLWHLDMVDQNSAVGTNDYSYCETGSGVYVYVIDTGVLRSHREFADDPGRVLDGYDATGDPGGFPAYDPCGGPGLFNQPPDGQRSPAQVRGIPSHGTGVASLIAGRNLGVARDAKIVPIKMFPCARFGARNLNANTPNTYYATNELVYANSSYYNVKVGGYTGSTSTYPHTNWPWPPAPACCQTWGGVQLEYVGTVPQTPTVQMTIEGLDWILRSSNPHPRSPAVVTLSTYKVAGTDGVANAPDGSVLSLEDAIGNLLDYGIPVIASANNQDANACDTSPARMSRNNPNNPNDPNRPYKVITAGGTMLRNNPDRNPATGGPQVNLPEPQYDPAKATGLARWRCHAGDSNVCSGNIYATPPPTPPDPSNADNYTGVTRGSNGGRCVTLFAPAKNIPVASLNGYDTYRNSRATSGDASGTSWSAPIVAAVAARILQTNPSYTVDQVYTALMNRTTPDLDPLELNPPGVTCPNDGQPCTTNKVLRMTPVVVQPLPAITPAVSGGNTSITVTASGAAGLTYELYEVNGSFDIATYNTGAASASKIQGPQSSNTFSVPSTGATSYFVRVRGICGTADTNITTVTQINAPAGVFAIGSSGTVTISWNGVPNATGYKIERKIGTGLWTLAQTVAGGSQTSVTDAPTVSTGVVLYRVRATQGSFQSEPSSSDVAYTKSFTDDPILIGAPFTTVRAKHLVEIRQAVNALRELGGAGPLYVGNDVDEPSVRTLLIQAAHLTTLMNDMNTARAAVGLPGMTFQLAPAAGGLVYGTQFANLRAGVK